MRHVAPVSSTPGRAAPRGRLAWLLVGAVLALAGGTVLVRADIASRRDTFQAEARTAHRLLSQRAAQHEAILATLVLLNPAGDAADRPEARLPAVYPQVLAVLRRAGGEAWPDAALAEAEARSRAAGHAELAALDTALGHATIVQAGTPASYALRIDLQRAVPWDTWPIRQGGPVRVVLRHGAQAFVVQPGAEADAQPAGLTPGFVFSKVVDAPGQPFELQVQRATGPAQWPWGTLLAWALAVALALGGVAAWQRARQARQRAEALLRVGQVARLNAMGELAAGLAHEINQPLTAVTAGAQAARRLLDDEPPELDAARAALIQVVAQGRRAADVVARLRLQVEAPDAARPAEAVLLAAVARQAIALREPEWRALGVVVAVQGHAPAVRADPVALEQIVHNLVGNALQALAEVPAGERRLLLDLGSAAGHATLTLRDSGPGFTDAALARLFEPFYTTKPGGLGLGLSLSESLAQAMHGTLVAGHASPRGAAFTLRLPLAEPAP